MAAIWHHAHKGHTGPTVAGVGAAEGSQVSIRIAPQLLANRSTFLHLAPQVASGCSAAGAVPSTTRRPVDARNLALGIEELFTQAKDLTATPGQRRPGQRRPAHCPAQMGPPGSEAAREAMYQRRRSHLGVT
jgi:hypothetical protein